MPLEQSPHLVHLPLHRCTERQPHMTGGQPQLATHSFLLRPALPRTPGWRPAPPSRGAPTQAQALGEIVTPAGEPRALPETQVRKNRNPSLSPGQTGHRTLSHLPSQTKRAHLTRLPFLSLPPELDEGQSSSNFTGLHCMAVWLTARPLSCTSS